MPEVLRAESKDDDSIANYDDQIFVSCHCGERWLPAGEWVLARDAEEPTTVSFAFATSAALIARELEDSQRLTLGRDGYAPEVIERHRALLEPESAKTPVAANFLFDLFLSLSSPQRELARAVAVHLERSGRRVIVDQQHLSAGKSSVEALSRALRRSGANGPSANGARGRRPGTELVQWALLGADAPGSPLR